MRIAIVLPWGEAKHYEPLIHDGLHAALDLIGKEHQVDWYFGDDEPEDVYDWILPWGVGSLPINFKLDNYKRARKALLCAGHPDDLANIEKFECVFVESPAVYEKMKSHCKKIVLAFGTDTSFFRPRNLPKIIDAFYPATFSPWKRQKLFAEAVGEHGLACGTVQPDGVEHLDACKLHFTHTLAGFVPTAMVARFYNMTKVCVITSWHGSERTALEAMASNTPLVVTKDNELTCSLLTDECLKVDPEPLAIWQAVSDSLNKKVDTRDYVIKNYSHVSYAQKILEGLNAR